MVGKIPAAARAVAARPRRLARARPTALSLLADGGPSDPAPAGSPRAPPAATPRDSSPAAGAAFPAGSGALGDKVGAGHSAVAVGAPLTPGTDGPVSGADEVAAFAAEYGLPIAIKAAFGGGGRGLKVARTAAEIPELYDSAVREAVAAFGRGACFVERYLDRPRHVGTPCLADSRGNG